MQSAKTYSNQCFYYTNCLVVIFNIRLNESHKNSTKDAKHNVQNAVLYIAWDFIIKINMQTMQMCEMVLYRALGI